MCRPSVKVLAIRDSAPETPEVVAWVSCPHRKWDGILTTGELIILLADIGGIGILHEGRKGHESRR